MEIASTTPADAARPLEKKFVIKTSGCLVGRAPQIPLIRGIFLSSTTHRLPDNYGSSKSYWGTPAPCFARVLEGISDSETARRGIRAKTPGRSRYVLRAPGRDRHCRDSET